MSENKSSAPEHDPSAELGLRNPVRDRERLGEEKYSVTPPRSEVRAPAEKSATKVSCRACNAELDPTDSYRIDADEYVYHFCSAQCHARWQDAEQRSHP
jgi:hypothetical protein